MKGQVDRERVTEINPLPPHNDLESLPSRLFLPTIGNSASPNQSPGLYYSTPGLEPQAATPSPSSLTSLRDSHLLQANGICTDLQQTTPLVDISIQKSIVIIY